jgi:hypothetical protein
MENGRYQKLKNEIISELAEVNKKIDFNDKWRIAALIGVSVQTVQNYFNNKKNYMAKIELAEKILNQANIIILEKEKMKKA